MTTSPSDQKLSPSPEHGAFDPATVEFYNDNAAEYASWTGKDRDTRFRRRMIKRIPKGGSILDLGCGAGWDSAAFVEAGFRVVAIDASLELLRHAQRIPRLEAREMPFEHLEDVDEFDGIWSSFSLQHIPRERMPAVAGIIARAMKPHGWLYIGIQKGPETRRDNLGRLYCHYQTDELERILSNVGFGEFTSEVTAGEGYDGSQCDLLHLEAQRIA